MKIKHQIIIEFDKGEKCFCCDEVFESTKKSLEPLILWKRLLSLEMIVMIY